MYEAFFGMEHTPFVRDVPPEKLYESNAFRETLGDVYKRQANSISRNGAHALEVASQLPRHFTLLKKRSRTTPRRFT